MRIISSIAIILFAFTANAQNNNTIKMKVAVWDTYVTKKDGSIMHFDIIAPEEIKDTTVIYGYGREYLKTKGQEGQPLTSKECRFCHIRQNNQNRVYPLTIPLNFDTHLCRF